MSNQTPEQIARDKIDRQLQNAGWQIQSVKNIDFTASHGVAVREYQTDTGPADYVLFVNGQPVGVIEAKPEGKAFNITTVEEQSGDYAKAKLKWLNNKQRLPFIYESTGTITRFTNLKDPKPRSREIFCFQKPETLLAMFNDESSFRSRLAELPVLNEDALRACQIKAIIELDKSLKEAKPLSLVQMATGSGKTFTAITAVYRWIKFAQARRILFLVDTKNLGEQAEQEFAKFIPNDEHYKFTELYNVLRLNSRSMPQNSQIYISTIQRMYSILKDEELDTTAEDCNLYEQKTFSKEPLPVVYNPTIPPEFFDVIIVDECHRSIYNTWQQVLKYFDSFIVGLTATPDERTFGFFNKNLVSEYTHENAVADGVNVGNEIFHIKTEKTLYGGKFNAGEVVPLRERLTRKKRWEKQDEDEAYSAKQLDRSVVNFDTIRTVIREFRKQLPTLFPSRKEIPKTLFFAKTDSHADDIIQLIREEFCEGNDFCRKITYQSKDDPKTVLNLFRNEFYPRIAVTVDMIATGTDIKPLECLVFLRDVKSRNYFEQMKGRGTRTLDKEGLQKVTPSATSAKTHYVIVDAVGVTESLKTASQPLITQKSVSMKDLAMGVLMGANDTDTITSLAGRLDRLDRQLEPKDQAKIEALTNGVSLRQMVKGFINAVDADAVQEAACEKEGLPPEAEPSEESLKTVQAIRVKEAAKVLTGTLITLLETIRKDKEQKIDESLDTVLEAQWAGDSNENAVALVASFEAFMQEHHQTIEALSIYYQQPYQRQRVTLQMLKEVLDILRSDVPKLAPLRVWDAYNLVKKTKTERPEQELQALLALIRHACGIDETLTPSKERIHRNFQRWVMDAHKGDGQKFTEAQMDWLRMFRDHVVTSLRVEPEDLDHAPFNAYGGLGKVYQLFGENYQTLLETVNTELAL
jgi:type I restriction enzyme R subunit